MICVWVVLIQSLVSWMSPITDGGEMGNKIIIFNIFMYFYYSMLGL